MHVFCILVVNMAELHCDLREEQRAYCKIRETLGKCASKIKADLDYGENVLHIEQYPCERQCLRKVELM
jgi:hypothetical protein